MEIDDSASVKGVLLTEQNANEMAQFWDLLLTEFNVAKADKGNHDASEQKKTGKEATAPGGHKAGGAQESSADGNGLDDLYNLCAQVGVRKEIGRKAERTRISPESVSYQVLRHCLLGMGSDESEAACRAWDDLDQIMSSCCRHVEPKASARPAMPAGDGRSMKFAARSPPHSTESVAHFRVSESQSIGASATHLDRARVVLM